MKIIWFVKLWIFFTEEILCLLLQIILTLFGGPIIIIKWAEKHMLCMGIKAYDCMYKISPKAYEELNIEKSRQKEINILNKLYEES